VIRWLRRITATLLVAGVALAPVSACSDGDALVGGDCASGYAPCGNGCCPVADDASLDATRDASSDSSSTDSSTDGMTLADGTTDASDTGLPDAVFLDRSGPERDGAADGALEDGESADGSGLDGSADVAETGPLCMPPLVDCGGVCVNTTNDPFDCGHCFNVCPSQICVNSVCQGSTAGGVVFIGHDYLTTPAGTAQARVLSNAVFIPQSNPLNVMSYERYASAAAVARVKSILNGFATQEGRGLSITSTSVDTDIPNKLVLSMFQVLIVQDQSTAPAGALATLGASWATTLTTFTQAGGIVVVLDGGTGAAQMPAFSTATTLLRVTAQSTLATGTPVDDTAPGDAVGVGVVSPYGAGKNSVSITTEPSGASVIYVIDLPSDAASPLPVVVHKVF
jgi:hypothetical protein